MATVDEGRVSVAAEAPADAPLRARDLAPDTLKGLAIYGVVLIHATDLFVPTPTMVAASATARLGVPLFIITWAFFAEKGFARGKAFRDWALTSYRGLGRLFLIWTTFYCILSADWHLKPTKFVSHYWLGSGWSGQYFFLILFLLLPCMPALRWIASRPPAVIALGIATLALYCFVGIHAISLYGGQNQRIMPYYWAGYALLGILLARSRRTGPIAGLAAVILPATFALLDPAYANVGSPYFTPAVLIAGGLIAWAMMNRPIVPSGVAGAIGSLGQNTLGIFVLNPLIPLFLHAYAPFGGGLPALLLLALASTCACWAATYALSRSPGAYFIS